jgi:hypothetical protein
MGAAAKSEGSSSSDGTCCKSQSSSGRISSVDGASESAPSALSIADVAFAFCS